MRLVLLAFFLISCLPHDVAAQEKDKAFYLKNYVEYIRLYQKPAYTTYNAGPTSQSIRAYTNSNIKLINPGFSLLSGKRSMHEFIIRGLNYTRAKTVTNIFDKNTGLLLMTIRRASSKDYYLNFTYEYAYSLIRRDKTRERKLHPYLGLLIEPVIRYITSIPVHSYSFPRWNADIYYLLALTPRLQYAMSEKVNIDFSAALPLHSNRGNFQKNENPALTKEQQFTGTWNLTFLPNRFFIRLGLSVKI